MENQNNDKLMAIVAYILFFIPLLAGKRTPFVTYHTNQGTVLFIFAIIGNFVLGIIPIFGWILIPVLHIATIVFAVIGILNASKMKMAPLPLIGGFTVIK